MKLFLLMLLFAVLMAEAANAGTLTDFAVRSFRGEKTVERHSGAVKVLSETFAGTTKFNHNQSGYMPISVAGTVYEHGIGVHANNVTEFALPGKAARFIACAGFDDAVKGSGGTGYCTVAADGREVFRSEPMTADGSGVNIDVPLDGAGTLVLAVTRPDGTFSGDWFNWGGAQVIMNDGSEIYLDSLADMHISYDAYDYIFGGRFDGKRDTLTVNAENPFCTALNRSVTFSGISELQTAGQIYSHGIGTAGNTSLVYRFTEPIVRFQTTAGLDGNGIWLKSDTSCSVKADGRTVYEKGGFVMGSQYEILNISLDNVTELELAAQGTQDGDHFDWADARVTTASGREIYLDTIHIPTRIACCYPFSFMYGGESSDILLPRWNLTETRKISDGKTEETEYTWQEPGGGLTVRAEVKLYTDCSTADWTVWFENNGTAPTGIISRMRGLDMSIAEGLSAYDFSDHGNSILNRPDYPNQREVETDTVLYTLSGTAPWKGLYHDIHMTDFQLSGQYLQNGRAVSVRHTAPHHGMSPTSGDGSPYFALRWPEGGMICAMGWTGSGWSLDAELTDRRLSVSAGTGDTLNTYLNPGEKIRSPRILLTLFDGENIEAGFNLYRKAMLRYGMPQEKGRPRHIPLAYTVSATEIWKGTEETDTAYIEAAKDLGFEYTWVDAYIQNMTGVQEPLDNIIDSTRYPRGFEPLARLIKKYGMKTMMWICPESVPPGNPIREQHPEYVMGEGEFALVNPDARAWMVELLARWLKKWNVTIMKNDYSTAEESVKQYLGAESDDRRGYAENVFCQSLYAFWDELAQAVPGLTMDNCGGGSSRLDLEMSTRSLSVGRSDLHCHGDFFQNQTEQARMNQVLTMNLNYMVPWTTGFQSGWTPYAIRSGFNSGLSYVGNLIYMTQEQREELKRGLGECRRLRKYLEGDFFVLYSDTVSKNDWCAWQYAREHDGYFVAFRRQDSGIKSIDISLRGIKPEKYYKLYIYETYDMKETKTVKGSELLKYSAEIGGAPGSLLVEYKEL